MQGSGTCLPTPGSIVGCWLSLLLFVASWVIILSAWAWYLIESGSELEQGTGMEIEVLFPLFLFSLSLSLIN